MPFEFRPAKRENVPLMLGLSGGTGSGKTYTAMRLASGIAGDRPFAVIDTENRRARHYADTFRFDAADLEAPFSPERYADAITAADKAGYSVIVVDSASHEYAGEGGVLDMQEDELERMAGSEWKRREACKMASWIKPKMEHKRFVNRLLQIRAHLILCFRAEPKVEMVKGEGGKWEFREKQSLVGLGGWIPITEKNLPYELTASFLLMAEHPGVPLPIKLQAQHRGLFPPGEPITEECGRRIAEWAAGGAIDWLARITAANSHVELESLAKQIAGAKTSIPESALTIIQAEYKDRWNTLARGKGQPSLIASNA